VNLTKNLKNLSQNVQSVLRSVLLESSRAWPSESSFPSKEYNRLLLLPINGEKEKG
jgi:hypothetical protein